MFRPETYESWAYETGFAHARAGREKPCKSQCNPAYWVGYQKGQIK